MNPFLETIVASPWENQRGDVPGIHQAVYTKCLDAIEQVRKGHRSTALLIHGEAGSGKTHLLSRLRARLTPRSATATDREESLFIWVRLQTSPRMIWRTLRRTLVDDWFRPIDGVRSQFDRVLFHRLSEIRVAEGDLEPWYEYMLQECPNELQLLLEQIADVLDLDRNTAVAFEHIAFGRHRRDLRAWLRGDSLPESALNRLGLSQDEGTDESREDQAQQVVLMLCRLAGKNLPVVMSFDQVEALQSVPGDTDGLFAFGKLSSTLHDETKNVFIVSCVQSAFATELHDHARKADYDRMKEFGALSLDPLNPQEAKELIRSRITATSVGSDIEGSQLGSDTWPLTAVQFDELFSGALPLTPRRLLGFCAEQYETVMARRIDLADSSQQTQFGTDESKGSSTRQEDFVEAFLNDKWSNSVEKRIASNSQKMTEEIILHGLPMLIPLVAPELQLVINAQLPDVSLVYEKDSARIGISVCTQPNMTSLAARLKRLKDQFKPHLLQKLVLVRDAREPISPAAKKAQQYLNDLESAGAIVIHPVSEVLGALDALRDLLSDAKSGDLACGALTISTMTVEEWLRSNLTESLRQFVDEIIECTDPANDAQAVQMLEEVHSLLSERQLLALNDAAKTLNQSSEKLEQFLRQHPDQFVVVAGDPLVVFRAVKDRVGMDPSDL